MMAKITMPACCFSNFHSTRENKFHTNTSTYNRYTCRYWAFGCKSAHRPHGKLAMGHLDMKLISFQDAIFENMTHGQWSLQIQSKVDTSWNVHQLLPKDLDFFILLSSVMRIYANPSQSNYAAGCVSQDTLARSRTVQGLRGSVSFDTGYMRSVGYAARRSADGQVIRANARKLVPIETEEFPEILDRYCDPGRAPLDDTHSQLLSGARTAADHTARRGEADPALLFWQVGDAEER